MPIKGTPCTPFMGESDAGRLAIGGFWRAASAVLAAANTVASAFMSEKQMEIARQYYKISRNWRDWYNQKYVPLENQELAEAWALEKTVPHYDAAIGRAKASGRFIFKDRLEKKIRCTSQYDTGLRGAYLKDEVNSQATALAAMAGLGQRNEQARVDALDDRRWKRREQVLNRGRDMMSQNVAFGALASGIYGDLAKQAGAGAAGAMYFLGYSGERQVTEYPGGLGHQRQTRSPVTYGLAAVPNGTAAPSGQGGDRWIFDPLSGRYYDQPRRPDLPRTDRVFHPLTGNYFE